MLSESSYCRYLDIKTKKTPIRSVFCLFDTKIATILICINSKTNKKRSVLLMNVEMERFANFMAEMIEKYADKIDLDEVKDVTERAD